MLISRAPVFLSKAKTGLSPTWTARNEGFRHHAQILLHTSLHFPFAISRKVCYITPMARKPKPPKPTISTHVWCSVSKKWIHRILRFNSYPNFTHHCAYCSREHRQMFAYTSKPKHPPKDTFCNYEHFLQCWRARRKEYQSVVTPNRFRLIMSPGTFHDSYEPVSRSPMLSRENQERDVVHFPKKVVFTLRRTQHVV